MKVLSAEFIRSCLTAEQFPSPHLPEVAFVGRSNVGKSSLINSLLYRRSLAKVSRTPGKTRAVNVFHVTTSDAHVPQLYLIDLPGYGYAKVAKSIRARWGPLIEAYLTERPTLRAIVVLVEARVVGPHDRLTLEWVASLGYVPIVTVTKADKVTRSERHRRLSQWRAALNLSEDIPMILYSSVTHEGREALWGVLRARLRT